MEAAFKRRVKRLAAWAAGLCLVACGAIPVMAEKPGATIVAQAADGRIVEGELLSVGNGEIEILVKPDAVKVRLRLDELEALRYEGKSRILPGLGIGLLAGGILGGMLGLLDDGGDSGWIIFSQGETAAMSAVLVGGAGGLIGGVVGALRGRERLIRLRPVPPGGTLKIEARLAKHARFGYRRDVGAE
ncbi:MAG TPA: hypothetical protein PK919_08790 [Candidatus Aminicenantes bacterium]|nr:hypothetical protein [Candidatus Aminicenantes bacterium]